MRTKTCTADVVPDQRAVVLWKLFCVLSCERELPDWLTKKATTQHQAQSCSYAGRKSFRMKMQHGLKLVEELYVLPQKPPVTVHQSAVWFEEHVTK